MGFIFFCLFPDRTPEVPSRGRISLSVCKGRGVRDPLTLILPGDIPLTLTLSRRERERLIPLRFLTNAPRAFPFKGDHIGLRIR